jgi:adenine-specific DNA-methyltransferase
LSRLTDLIAEVKAKDPQTGADLEREFKALSSRLPFGLNFERHRPEAVELPLRPIRKGDKVRILPERGSTAKGDQRLWQVMKIAANGRRKVAELQLLDGSQTETTSVPWDDLIVVAEFKDTIYPGLVSTGKVERGGDKPYHTVINAENYHALKALTWSHRGKVDAIYIDPPYNTGAKDWKYNNDYVEGDDLYRHSKWLAFMERRLALAKELLSPRASVLIVTIDEKEYLRLGLLLEQVFPEAKIVMVSAVINRSGVVRENEFTRTSEFIFFVMIGRASLTPERNEDSPEVRWASLRRFEDASRRHGPSPRPDQFYPIFVRRDDLRIELIGDSIGYDVERSTVPDLPGCITVWPLKPDGTEMIWGLTPATARRRLAQGYVRVAGTVRGRAPTIYYLTSGQVAEIESGEIVVTGRAADGSVEVRYRRGRGSLPSTQWDKDSHQSKTGGTALLASLIPSRRFPFPKSLYAVEDALRYVVADNKTAVVLDFFAGSGTTAHAVMRLNRQDEGRRHSISVTNNEVAAGEQIGLAETGLRSGDAEWEKWGISEYITKPRIAAAISGKTPDGEPLEGNYRFTDEFPMSDGLQENAEFFTLTYESPVAVAHHIAFARIAPLLWIRAGSRGNRIETIPGPGWEVVDAYGILIDLDQATPFLKAVRKEKGLGIAYVVTDDERRFQAIARRLPRRVEAVRLYESYLTNFAFANGSEA